MTYYVTKGYKGSPCTISTKPSFEGREIVLPEEWCKLIEGAMRMYGELNSTLTILYDTPSAQHINVQMPPFIENAVKPKATTRAK